MHSRTSKRGRSAPLIQAASLAAALIISFALARTAGGSFSVGAKPQISAVSAEAGEGASRAGLAAMAGALRERYGVRVLTGGELLPVSAYSMEPCGDPEEERRALMLIEKTFSAYPKGFFDRLGAASGGIVIELCGAIRARDASVPESPSAIAADCLSFRLIALEAGNDALGFALMHELCHIIDACLDMASGGDDPFWNEADWMRLCPEGFAYYNAYNAPDGTSYSIAAPGRYAAEAPFDRDEVYFINRYSKTFATEDRAVAFETLMRVSEEAECMGCPHVIEKLEYYFRAIRHFLDADCEWAEPTFWEEKLENVKKAAGLE